VVRRLVGFGDLFEDQSLRIAAWLLRGFRIKQPMKRRCFFLPLVIGMLMSTVLTAQPHRRVPPADDGRVCLADQGYHEIWASGISGPVTVYDEKGNVLADSVLLGKSYLGYRVHKNGKCGYISTEERLSFLPPVYDSIVTRPANDHFLSLDYGFVLVQKGGKWGVAQYDREITAIGYDSIHGFGFIAMEPCFITYSKGKQGFINGRGHVIAKPEYDSVLFDPQHLPDNPFVALKQNGKYEVRNALHYRFQSKAYYDSVDVTVFPLYGKLLAYRNGGWAALNEKCRECIAPGYVSLENWPAPSRSKNKKRSRNAPDDLRDR
jgi:hypothetical protein